MQASRQSAIPAEAGWTTVAYGSQRIPNVGRGGRGAPQGSRYQPARSQQSVAKTAQKQAPKILIMPMPLAAMQALKEQRTLTTRELVFEITTKEDMCQAFDDLPMQALAETAKTVVLCLCGSKTRMAITAQSYKDAAAAAYVTERKLEAQLRASQPTDETLAQALAAAKSASAQANAELLTAHAADLHALAEEDVQVECSKAWSTSNTAPQGKRMAAFKLVVRVPGIVAPFLEGEVLKQGGLLTLLPPHTGWSWPIHAYLVRGAQGSMRGQLVEVRYSDLIKVARTMPHLGPTGTLQHQLKKNAACSQPSHTTTLPPKMVASVLQAYMQGSSGEGFLVGWVGKPTQVDSKSTRVTDLQFTDPCLEGVHETNLPTHIDLKGVPPARPGCVMAMVWLDRAQSATLCSTPAHHTILEFKPEIVEGEVPECIQCIMFRMPCSVQGQRATPPASAGRRNPGIPVTAAAAQEEATAVAQTTAAAQAEATAKAATAAQAQIVATAKATAATQAEATATAQAKAVVEADAQAKTPAQGINANGKRESPKSGQKNSKLLAITQSTTLPGPGTYAQVAMGNPPQPPPTLDPAPPAPHMTDGLDTHMTPPVDPPPTGDPAPPAPVKDMTDGFDTHMTPPVDPPPTGALSS